MGREGGENGRGRKGRGEETKQTHPAGQAATRPQAGDCGSPDGRRAAAPCSQRAEPTGAQHLRARPAPRGARFRRPVRPRGAERDSGEPRRTCHALTASPVPPGVRGDSSRPRPSTRGRCPRAPSPSPPRPPPPDAAAGDEDTNRVQESTRRGRPRLAAAPLRALPSLRTAELPGARRLSPVRPTPRPGLARPPPGPAPASARALPAFRLAAPCRLGGTRRARPGPEGRGRKKARSPPVLWRHGGQTLPIGSRPARAPDATPRVRGGKERLRAPPPPGLQR